jgi:lipopolysaccharide transport system ATP-binding protein
MILENGSNREISFDVKKEITKYLRGENPNELSSIYLNNTQNHINFKLESFYLSDEIGNNVENIQDNSLQKYLCIKYNCEVVDPSLEISIFIYDEENNLIFTSSSTDTDRNLWPLSKIGKNLIVCEIPQRLLNEGKYKVQLFASLYRKEWIIDPGKLDISIYFEIKGGLSNSPHWISKRDGLIAPVLVWKKID